MQTVCWNFDQMCTCIVIVYLVWQND